MMKRLIRTILFLSTLGCKADSLQNQPVVYGFDNIEPSPNLTWTPCFKDFTCSRLQVPLDYSNKSLGTTSIAFIKIAGKNATMKSPNIVFLPGGPGGSGIDLLLTNATIAQQVFGQQYNIVSFDPRGVNNSGPTLDCFAGNAEARQDFHRLHNKGATNISSTSLEEQYYSSAIYGEWCNDVVKKDSPHGYYVTTPSVARDLLTFIEANARNVGQSSSDAKLWAYGTSYGSVTGATFASIFPDRVERMILDGIVDAELYYRNDYSANVDQMDEAIDGFARLCHSAGPKKCSFWGPTPSNITSRINKIITQLQNHPVPISRAQSRELPTMVTYSDLKAAFLNAIYLPIATFPTMADVLRQVERGDVSGLAGTFESSIIPSDSNHVIQCADASRTNSLNTIDEFKSYVEYTTNTSKYIGDVYPISVDSILCRSIQPRLPDSMMVQGPISGRNKPRPFPIVFASNTIDPITPLRSAQRMSSRFPGSRLLLQEAIGHTVINQGGSDCYFGHVRAYFQGTLPPANTTCSQQYTPFINSPF